MTVEEFVCIRTPDCIHNNYGLECYLYDPNKVYEFHEFCMTNFPSYEFGTFWQGGHGSEEWRYFEFWKGRDNQDAILRLGEQIATQLGFDLEIR